MTRDQIVDLFDRRMKTINDHDVEAFADLCAVDAVVECPLGGTHQGRAAIAAVAGAFVGALSDATFAEDALIIDGDHVVQVLTVSGTDTGGLMGMAPSGRPAQLPMVVVCQLADGLITHERRIYDFTGMLVQIGVLKAKPA
jgi:predicted ester cyclase